MASPIGDYLLESLSVLIVLVLLAAVVLYVARRSGLGRTSGSIELLARLPLEPRRSIYVVRVLDQILVLGASEAGLVKLGELPEGSASELRGAEPPAGFAAALDAVLRRQGPGGQSGEPVPKRGPS